MKRRQKVQQALVENRQRREERKTRAEEVATTVSEQEGV